MRETGVARRRAVGDPGVAAPYYGLGRTLLGRLKNLLGAGIAGAHTWLLPNGVRIRTSTGPHGDSIAIDVPIIGGVPLEPTPLPEATLFGLAFIPYSDSSPLGYNDPGTPDAEHLDYPEVVLKPVLDEGEVQYATYLYNAAHRPPYAPETFEASSYDKRATGTTADAKKIDWYPIGVAYGNLDWRGPRGEILSWFGGRDRYQNILPLAGTDATIRIGRYVKTNSSDTPYLVTGLKQAIPVPFTLTSGNVDTYLEYRLPMNEGCLFYKGKSAGSFNTCVRGAAIREYTHTDGTTRYKLVYVAGAVDIRVNVYQDVIFSCDFNPETGVASNQVQIGSHTYFSSGTITTTHWLNTSSWLFNASATQAVADRVTASAGQPTDRRQYSLAISWGVNGAATATITDTGVYSAEVETTTSSQTQGQVSEDTIYPRTVWNGSTCVPASDGVYTVYGPAQDYFSIVSQTRVQRFRDFRGDQLITGSITHAYDSSSSSSSSKTMGTCSNLHQDPQCQYNTPILSTVTSPSSHSASRSFSIEVDGAVLAAEQISAAGSGSWSISRACQIAPGGGFVISHSGTRAIGGTHLLDAVIHFMDMRSKDVLLEWYSKLNDTFTVPVSGFGDSFSVGYTQHTEFVLFHDGAEVDKLELDITGTIGADGVSIYEWRDSTTIPNSPGGSSGGTVIDNGNFGQANHAIAGESAWYPVSEDQNVHFSFFSGVTAASGGSGTYDHTELTGSDPATETALAGTNMYYALIGII